ncbi:MAG: DUF4331 domain-containing protein [Gammaproteobacteria bacterium]|nr:DUF4331 domain-containing protein [Gammaproteobacteria bacterium]
MLTPRKPKLRILPAILAALCSAGTGTVAQAANHREAPLTALDSKADITDWFAFVSYNDPTKLTMILNVDPLLQPSNGPNYFPFDPEIQYEMKVDNNFDADEDLIVRVRFKTEIRAPGVFTGLLGVGNGIATPSTAPQPPPPGSPLLPPAITALDGPGSEGFNLRQSYTVSILKKQANGQFTEIMNSGSKKLFAVPSNVGPRTMPNYPALAQQGIYDLGQGVKVFAGTVDDPFYIDLGAAFDTLNFRAGASKFGIPAVLSDAQDGADDVNFAHDSVSGFNVNSIAIELPITLLTSDNALHAAGEAKAVLGTYATTSRPRIKVQPLVPGGKAALSTVFTQIQRMGNPLINELIIGTGDKDKFSMSEPKGDGQFANYFLDPLLARAINAAYKAAFNADVLIPPPPRLDLLPLVKYVAPICPGCTAQQAGPIADLLRINTGIGPTAKANRKRMAVLAGDFGGFPNGRRVSDDVTDIAARAVVGVLNPAFNVFPNNRIGDGTNTNDRPYQETFPYVAFANDGRNSRHVDAGEPGCADVTPPFLPKNCPLN